MSQKLLYMILFFCSYFVVAQQNTEFRSVKEYYDRQRNMITESFQKEVRKMNSVYEVEQISNDFSEFMVKLDSIQNMAFLSALIKVKNREDLERLQPKNNLVMTNDSASKPPMKEIPAQYPGGIDELRKQVAQIFYLDALQSTAPKLSTDIYFVVEKDGSIAKVRATGDNFIFNRQAEIAVYLLPEKFSPATLNGEKVRYSFRIPLAMNFE